MESLSAFWKKVSWADCIRKGGRVAHAKVGWLGETTTDTHQISFICHAHKKYIITSSDLQVTVQSHIMKVVLTKKLKLWLSEYSTAGVTKFHTNYLMIYSYFFSLWSLVGGWMHSEPAALIHGSCTREHHMTHALHGSYHITVAYSCLAGLWSQYYKPVCPWRERLRDNEAAAGINANRVNAVECHTVLAHTFFVSTCRSRTAWPYIRILRLDCLCTCSIIC